MNDSTPKKPPAVATTRTRLTADEKQAWQKFCRDNNLSEADMLRRMIQHVTAGQVPIEFPGFEEGRTEKITIRLTPANHRRLSARAKAEGFPNRTSWTTAVILGILHRAPVLGDAEVSALRESNRELAAIGRNLNQVAHALNIDYRQTERVKREIIEALAQRIDQHKNQVYELLNKSMNRWGDDD